MARSNCAASDSDVGEVSNGFAHFALPQAGWRKAVDDLAPVLTMTRGKKEKPLPWLS
jgi:hypothetical protein